MLSTTDNANMRTLLHQMKLFFLVCLIFGMGVACADDNDLLGGTEVGNPSANVIPPSNSTTLEDADTSDDAVSTAFTTLAQGVDGDVSFAAQQQFLESQTALDAYWLELFPDDSLGAPTVDFSSFHVAFVVMGAQSLDATTIITTITLTDTDFDVTVTETTSDASCTNTEASTNPYHIVQIDKNSATLSRHFRTETLTNSCE